MSWNIKKILPRPPVCDHSSHIVFLSWFFDVIFAKTHSAYEEPLSLSLSLSTFGPVLHHIMTSLSVHLLLLLGKLSRKVWYYKNIPTSSQHGLRTLKPGDTYKQFRLLYKNTLLLYNLWLRPMYCCDWCNIFKWLTYQQIDFFPFSYQRKTNSLKRQEHSTLALKKKPKNNEILFYK